ncbi:MAG TPA: hypothetical protein RMH99_27155 [Sandaracinaceae bacterium LLY-WYZ-13_1]|nr:hypothetical protein [Sandaracinaceae bacterium LLY-WYZ-13_1]
MPIELRRYDGGTGEVQVCSGRLTGDELLAIDRQRLGVEGALRGLRYHVTDLTGVTELAVTPDEVRRIVAQSVSLGERFPRAALAVVASEPLHYGMARVWMAHMERLRAPEWCTNVLSSWAEMEAWVAAEVERLFGERPAFRPDPG